jgi:hypothetical protein
MDKELGDNKGVKENPMTKHALTKSNCFEWVHFGEYVDIKRNGCQTTVHATKKNNNKKVMMMMKKKQVKVKKN